jgi:hypothetical protein
MSFRSVAGFFTMMRATRRPMRPKPLMPQGTADMEVGMVRAAAELMASARTTAENCKAAHEKKKGSTGEI